MEIFYLTKITDVEIDDTINKYSTININNTNLRKKRTYYIETIKLIRFRGKCKT